MRAKFAANVASEKSPVLRVMPLFIKNIAMKAVFDAVGECKSCLCLSNLGNVQLPEAMAPTSGGWTSSSVCRPPRPTTAVW